MSECIVRIARVPGLVKEVALNGERTVAAACDVAEVSTDGMIHVNGVVARPTTEIYDGDRITISAGAKGNS
jgi:ribosomal 50S subunit-recycling heat shock protein